MMALGLIAAAWNVEEFEAVDQLAEPAPIANPGGVHAQGRLPGPEAAAGAGAGGGGCKGVPGQEGESKGYTINPTGRCQPWGVHAQGRLPGPEAAAGAGPGGGGCKGVPGQEGGGRGGRARARRAAHQGQAALSRAGTWSLVWHACPMASDLWEALMVPGFVEKGDGWARAASLRGLHSILRRSSLLVEKDCDPQAFRKQQVVGTGA